MSDIPKHTKSMIEWRRNKVLHRLAMGRSQAEISKELQTHIQEGIPLEYLRARTGLNNVLKRVSEIEDQATDTKTKLECSKLKMELYRSIMSLAYDGSVIERAMKMIKVISPLPGEDIPAKSEEDKDNDTTVDAEVEAAEEESETKEE